MFVVGDSRPTVVACFFVFDSWLMIGFLLSHFVISLAGWLAGWLAGVLDFVVDWLQASRPCLKGETDRD